MYAADRLLICDNDKFATCNGLVFYYNANMLSCEVIKVEQLPTITLYVISRIDFERIYGAVPAAVTFEPFRQLIANLNMIEANQLSKALQLLRWRDDHQYCSRCGNITLPAEHEYAMRCSQCDYHQYPRIQPCIITAIVKYIGEQPCLLLAHHHRAKESGMYGLIAGFVEVGESLEQCVHREVLEEVGLTVKNLRYFTSQPWPFPSNLMVGFLAEYDSGDIQLDESELIHADFFAIDRLGQADSPKIPPKGTIAYDLIRLVRQAYA